MYRTTTNCTTELVCRKCYLNGKYGLPLTLHSMIGLNDMDQKVCDQDAEKKKESRNTMDNQGEGN